MRRSLFLVFLFLALLNNACSALRLEVGVGTGIGVGVKVPYFYNGGLLLPSAEVRMGHNYAEGWHAGHGAEPADEHKSVDYDVALLLGASEARSSTWGAPLSGWGDPFLLGSHEPEIAGTMNSFSLFPIGWAGNYPGTHALEINLHLFVSIHIGWNPYYWYTRPDKRTWKIRPTLRDSGAKDSSEAN